MTNDDSRGLENPDRRDASTATARDPSNDPTDTNRNRASVRDRLESITALTDSLLEDSQTADEAPLSEVDGETRRDVTRRLREVRAEADRVGCELVGPEVALSDRGDAEPTSVDESLPTVYRGP